MEDRVKAHQLRMIRGMDRTHLDVQLDKSREFFASEFMVLGYYAGCQIRKRRSAPIQLVVGKSCVSAHLFQPRHFFFTNTGTLASFWKLLATSTATVDS